jgi:general secretion pathway protein D
MAGLLSITLAGTLPAGAQLRPTIPSRNPSRGAAPTQPSAPSRPSSRPDTQRLISLNFRDAPLDQVLGFYGELTGRTMIKSPGLNATITLRGQTRLTQDEALDAITSILAMNNITLVPMGEKFFKVVQTANARQEGMPIEGQIPETMFEDTDQLISQLVTLKHIKMSDAQPIVQSLLHGYAKIQTLERINSLLITATSGNLQRVMEILEYIDQPVELKVETRIYELRYAEASKIAGKLNELIQSSKEQTKEEAPQATAPQPRTPPGVIRARQARQQQQQQAEGMSAAELAERGIIQGDVKIVSDDRTNIMIVISEPPNFIFFDKIVAVLDRPVEPETIVKVVALEYADAEEISSILNTFIGAASSEKDLAGAAGEEEGAEGEETSRSRALQQYLENQARQRTPETGEEGKSAIGRLSSNTKILADKRTNSLLLMGRRSDIRALEDVIDELDIMLAQVLIEAVILEVNLSDSLEYGIEWLQRALTVYDNDNAGPGGGIQVRQPVMSFAGGQKFSSDTTFRDASQLVSRDIPLSAGALTYYTTFFDLNLDAMIRLLASSSNARILQTPVILTTDNTEAKIVVGEERPIVTSTTTSSSTDNQTSHYEYKNIGVNLTVTPRINPARFVVMEINQTVDNVGDFVQIDGNDVPVITKREMSAQIAIESRSTIVLGGLVQTADRFGRTKIPILGDIPLLGSLFRDDSKNKNRTELMVLLTPYVMTTPEEAREETTRLKQSSRAGETPWPEGWSDSPLATPTAEAIKKRKQAEKELQRKQAREARRAERIRQRELREKRLEEERRQKMLDAYDNDQSADTAEEAVDAFTDALYAPDTDVIDATGNIAESINEEGVTDSEMEESVRGEPLPAAEITISPEPIPHSRTRGKVDTAEPVSENNGSVEPSPADPYIPAEPKQNPEPEITPIEPEKTNGPLPRKDPVLPGNGARPAPNPQPAPGNNPNEIDDLINELNAPVPM